MVGIPTIQKLIPREATLLDGDMLTLGNPPAWAEGLVKQVAFDYRRSDLPTLYWYRKRTNVPRTSSGVTQACTVLSRYIITVRTGFDLDDQKHVLLHELAHWLVGNRENHNTRFYTMFFELVDHYHMAHFSRSVGRERKYKPYTSTAGRVRYERLRAQGAIIRPRQVEMTKAAMRRDS